MHAVCMQCAWYWYALHTMHTLQRVMHNTYIGEGGECEGKWCVTGEHLTNDAARTTESIFAQFTPKTPPILFPKYPPILGFFALSTNYGNQCSVAYL